jgi:hypothetical protein
MSLDCFKQLRRLFPGARVRAFRRSQISCSAEQFEVRLMPSGNVIATVVDGTLTLNGDSEDNSVRVEISGGNVVVTGLDGTTINGDADFEAVTGSTTIAGDLVARLGLGDDTLVIGDDVVIDGNVRVTDFFGVTTLGMRSVEIGGNLLVQTGRGDDRISLDDTTIGGDARIATHRGKDFVSLLQTTVTGKIAIVTGGGADGVVVDDSTLSSSARLDSGRGRDRALIRETTIAGDVSARTGAGADFLMLQNSTVDGKSKALLGQGADSFVTRDTNEFKGDAVVRGQRGRDSIDISAGTTFDAGQRVHGFRNHSVSDSLIDDILNNADTGLLTLASDLRDEIDALLS